MPKRTSMARRSGLLVLAGIPIWLSIAGAAIAGTPPATCRVGNGNGCALASDLLIFAEGDPQYQIVARITECHLCSAPNAAGVFQFNGEADVDFGPYDPAIPGCVAADGVVHLFLVAGLRPGAGGGGPGGNESTYIPDNPNQAFNFQATPELTPACVDQANLEYRFQDLELTGAAGLESLTGWLVQPESVRAAFSGVPAPLIGLQPLRLQQNLGFTSVENKPPSSSLRWWAEGLPFRLGPDVITYTADKVQFTTPGGAAAPPAYTPHPLPSWADAGLLSQSQVKACAGSSPEPGDTCTTAHIRNSGYLDHAGWLPSNGRFDRNGLTVTLALPIATQVLYQTVFPRDAWIKLLGPATVTIQDSAIVSGTFQGGTTWITLDRDACIAGRRLRYGFMQGPGLQPVIGADGGLLAGIANLQELDASLQPQEILWTVNEASGLGCGTLWAPPPLAAATTPQKSWLASAVAPIHGRGVYAGLNYNRNRVCQVSMVPTGQFCAVDADCNPGESCVDAGFSPRCPALPVTPIAQWHTTVQDRALQFAVDPDAPGQGDREMAFFGRKSGITGVFDAGDNTFSIGNPTANPASFDFQFTTFGLAYLGSETERADTIAQGTLRVPWPSDTAIPFEEMEICDCGAVDKARTPDVLFEKTLAYWDAKFFPYGLEFKKNPSDPCDESQCSTSTQAAEVCITALTPIPHFDPEPTSVFDLTPTGEVPTGILPFSVSRMDFSRDKEGEVLHPPYSYDIEKFALQPWLAAGAPSSAAVMGGTADFGYYDAVGDLSLPFFGLAPAGIKIERRRVSQLPADHLVDLHRECDPDANPGCDPEDPILSYIEVERRMAGDSVLMHYKADYVHPEETKDQDDGSDGAFRGRGPVLAFSYDPHNTGSADEKATVNFGSLSAATSLILKPDPGPDYPGVVIGGDLGPAAAMRLYDVMNMADSDELDTIMPPGYLTGSAIAAYEDALDALGYSGNWYETVKPAEFMEALQATQAIELFAAHPPQAAHPAYAASYNVNPNGASPPMSATELVGAIDFSDDFEVLEQIEIGSNLDTGGQFFQMEGALQTIDRHVKEGEEPISQFTREILPSASNKMQLPGEQDIAFPNIPGMTWDFDYDVVTTPVPEFTFKSLTGTLDLTKGGFSGVGFDKAGFTLKFDAEGNWHLVAALKVDWNGYGIEGDILLGNTKDMTPLRDMDPAVAGFLKGIPAFQGAYVRCGMSAKMFDYGCLFEVGAGVQVGGWFLSESFGGKVRGWLTGQGACIVSVRGDLTLLGDVRNDAFRFEGLLWVAGGIGFCDEEDWDSPADVLDDDFCAACVLSGKARGKYPPGKISFSGPDVDCSL